MRVVKRILPVISITLVVLLITQALYSIILGREEKRCWQELSSTADTVKDGITTKFMDEISKLHLIESIIVDENAFTPDNLKSLHIDKILKGTFFSRIDVVFPDNTIVSNGIDVITNANVDFNEISLKGEYLTARTLDTPTGREYIYYILPIRNNSVVSAVLIGGIDSNNLANIFKPRIYNGKANICIIDADDGSYIMDSWHDSLGNAFASNDRRLLKGYEDVDFKNELRNLTEGAVAFESKTTGKPLYLYYTPIGIYNWQLSIFAEESVLFENLFSLRKLFVFVGILETIILMLYFLWNINTVKQLEKSNNEIKKQEEQLTLLSYHDSLTGMYNRNKYEEVCAQYQKGRLENIGIAYIDMNGLKRINDSEMHEAGDKYICNTANVIMKFFNGESYRIGGDEFVILSADIGLEEFTDKANKLFSEMTEKHLSVSYGLCWRDCCNDLDALLQKAEKDMYEDKKRYYQYANVSR